MTNFPNALTAIDFYKADHRRQYPKGTTKVYSNLTARSAKHSNIPKHLFTDGVIFFGLQSYIKEYLINTWNNTFFRVDKTTAVKNYKRRMDNSLGKDSIPVDHLEELHDLGYLPIKICALQEGTHVPIGVPMLTIENTHEKFFWLTNYLETSLSAFLWKPITSATTAFHYRLLLEKYANETGGNKEFVKWQGHDFSARGMSGIWDAASSGAGHLLSFTGTDTVSAIDFLEEYYGANSDLELIGGSVPATEHSVMCMGGIEDEIGTFNRLIEEVYPNGIVSIVSDTWDFFKVIDEYAPKLKDKILKRNGKVVFRPDSGDPVKIICGDPDAPEGSRERMGAMRILYKHFGGTINSKGYIDLNPKVGLIYGDSITPERCEEISKRLKEMLFSSTNMVYGIGSYTYTFVTRDIYGMAVKSTYGEILGEGRDIFKNPATDKDKMKKSLCGKVHVYRHGLTGLLTVDSSNHAPSELNTVFYNGNIQSTDLKTIRNVVEKELKKFSERKVNNG